MSKTIETLVEDIQELFNSGVTVSEEDAERFGYQLARIISDRLSEPSRERQATLRVSNLGKPDRQLYYEINGGSGQPKEELTPSTRLKFLYGDILECVLLFLSRVAGHTVEQEQATVEINGVLGHIDAIIDGHVVDCKSASTYAFRKFKDGTLSEDDPFGYIEQLAGYSRGTEGRPGAFLVVDKTLGHLTLLQYSAEELENQVDIPDRIEHLKEVLASDTLPERCYEPVPDGKSGNLQLAVGCSYCPFKQGCWSDANGGTGLKTFLYSQGPRHMVHVEKTPQVMEVFPKRKID